jgi:ribosomal-protein-alanine N-acetyltransferase
VQTRSPLDFTSITISGSRVRLVPVSPEHAEIIFREFTDAITRYMVPATPSCIEEVHDFIRSSITNMKNHSDLTLAILNREDGEFLGVCGLHGKSSPGEPALGIWLRKSAHGQKYGQETIAVLVGWARQNVIFNYLVYPCDRGNIASRKIAESLQGSIIRTGEVKSRSGRILHEIVYKIA